MEKQRWEESEKRRAPERRSEKRKSEKKEDAGARKGSKVTKNCVFFQWFVAPEDLKVGSLKRRVWSHLARRGMKTCTPWWCEAHFEVKMCKAHQVRSTFGSWDVETVHAVVARSTFPSQNAQNASCLERFWKWRCLKSACRCGAKHMSKSKVQKTDGYGAFGRSHIVSCGRRKGLCTLSKVNKTWRFCSSFNYNHHYAPLHYN